MGIRWRHLTARDFFIQSFCSETDTRIFANAGRLWNVSIVYMFMKFYFLPNENSNEVSFLIRELPVAIFNRSLSVHIRYCF